MRKLLWFIQILLGLAKWFKKTPAQDGADLAADTKVVIEPTDSTNTNTGPEYDLKEVEYVPEPIEPNPYAPQRYFWCLDPGHGSLSPGKRSPVVPGHGVRFFEWEANRDIVRRIVKELLELGINCMVTVPEDEVGNMLEERVRRANDYRINMPKFFLSVHFNAGPARSINHWTDDLVRGIETWHYHGSQKGRSAAVIFQRHLIAETGFKNRHLRSKEEGQFFVLRATRMPAVLTENGFFNNRLEVQELMKGSVRQAIADAHVAAILEIEENGL